MAGEAIKPLLSLPPGTNPATAAILIVQTLECKRLSCKCKLSKDILKHALKILLCDDDSSLFPNHKNQSINSVFQTRQCTSVAMQTDNSNQNDISVQTEKCRIKLQKSGYKYTFNGNEESSNVSTQVTFNDFADPINAEDSDEIEICIESPTEITKSKQMINGSDNQIISYIAKGQKKFKLDRHIFPLLNFHGKRLIDETQSRQPFIIPLVCNSNEVYDPRMFDSNIANKSEGSSHLPWRAQAICNCPALKRKKYYDQKENFGIVASADVRLNLPDENTNIKSNSYLMPLTSISENKLSAKDENYCEDIINSFPQNKVLDVTKARRATVTEGMPTNNYYYFHNDVKNKEAHLMDCFCNLAPREACASDPRIKLICADVDDSSDIKTRMKRNAASSNNKPLVSKKTKFEQCTEQIAVTQSQQSTTEKFGCLTPNESPAGSPETPVSLTSFSPESFIDEEHQNNSNQKSLHHILFNKNCLNTNSDDTESQILVPRHKKVLFKQISSINDKSDLLKTKEVNKKSITTQCHLSNSIECDKTEDDQTISHLLKGNSILNSSDISANPLLLSSMDEKNKSTKDISTENIISDLPLTNAKISTLTETSSNMKKSVNSIISQNTSLEYESNSAHTNNAVMKIGYLQIENKDNCEQSIENSNKDSLNINISERNGRFIPFRLNKCRKVRTELSDKFLAKLGETMLQNMVSSNLSEYQSKLPVLHKNDTDSLSNILDVPSYHTTDIENKQHFDDKVKLPAHPRNDLNTASNLLDIPSYCTMDSSNKQHSDNNLLNEEKSPVHSISNENSALNLLDIPSYQTSDDKHKKLDDSQPNLETTPPEEVYSPTDDLSMGSDCDDTMSTGCIASSPPDKSPILEVDKNENLIKTKEEKTNANPYQKVIAAVPSYMPTRRPSVPSADKSPIVNSDKCDKMPKQLQSSILNSDRCDKISTIPDTSASKTDDKINDNIPSYSTREGDSTASLSLHTVEKSVENEMTQTEPEMNEWNSCSPWVQPNSFQNYYKWCGQNNEFTSSHYQTYYPPYTNNYPVVAPNWMCYQWWNGNGSGWNQLW